MCFPTTCPDCHKTAWGGCGRHVAGVAASVKPADRCMHVSWPDMPKPAQQQPAKAIAGH
ncbi:hypothetical protein DFJ74DRAFT_704168 [Hyaloraphidium curvatum]|nr:hypothetical protein DFJ74DRAFT_704168 [Hyaloraphidium curvatum]